jgi:hypothetical protein
LPDRTTISKFLIGADMDANQIGERRVGKECRL